jgi:hypothetical protein
MGNRDDRKLPFLLGRRDEIAHRIGVNDSGSAHRNKERCRRKAKLSNIETSHSLPPYRDFDL